jgi:hypothetical protein
MPVEPLIKTNKALEQVADWKLYAKEPEHFINIETAAIEEFTKLLDNMLYRMGEWSLEWVHPTDSCSDEGFTYDDHMGGAIQDLANFAGIEWGQEAWDGFWGNVDRVYAESLDPDDDDEDEEPDEI